jgi:hypothetical protein
MKINELLRVGDGKRTQKHSIHYAEDGRVGSDSEGDGQDSDRGENRGFCQSAERVAKFLCEFRHTSTSDCSGVRIVIQQSTYQTAGGGTVELT